MSGPASTFPLNVELSYQGHVPRRAPRTDVLLRVTVRNTTDRLWWLVVPDEMADGPIGTGTISVDLYFLGEDAPPILFVRALRGFIAIPVPAGSTRDVERVPIIHRSRLPEKANVEVFTASAIEADGRPIEEVLDIDSAAGKQSVLDAAPLVDQREVRRAVSAPVGEEMSIGLLDLTRREVELTLA